MRTFLSALFLFATLSVQAQLTITTGETYKGETRFFCDLLVSASEDGYTTIMTGPFPQSTVRSFSANHKLLSETKNKPRYDNAPFRPGWIYTVGGKQYTIVSYPASKSNNRKITLVAGEIVDGKIENVRDIFPKHYADSLKEKGLDIYGYRIDNRNLGKQLKVSEDGQFLVMTGHSRMKKERTLHQVDVTVFDDNLNMVWSASNYVKLMPGEKFTPTKTLMATDGTVYILGDFEIIKRETIARRSVVVIKNESFTEYRVPLHSKADIQLLNKEAGGGCLLSGLSSSLINSTSPTGVFRIELSPAGEVLNNISAEFDQKILQKVGELKGESLRFSSKTHTNGNTLLFIESIKMGKVSTGDQRLSYYLTIRTRNLIILTYDRKLQLLNWVNAEKDFKTSYSADEVFLKSGQIGDEVYVLIRDKKRGASGPSPKGIYQLIKLDASGEFISREDISSPSNRASGNINRRNMRFLDDQIFFLEGYTGKANGVYIGF